MVNIVDTILTLKNNLKTLRIIIVKLICASVAKKSLNKKAAPKYRDGSTIKTLNLTIYRLH